MIGLAVGGYNSDIFIIIRHKANIKPEAFMRQVKSEKISLLLDNDFSKDYLEI
jgi:hypothetical protein